MSARLPPSVTLRAVEWLVALEAPDATPSTREAWKRWCSEHDDHARAWQQLDTMRSELRALPAPLVHGTLDRAADRAGNRRRKSLKLLCWTGMAGGSIWIATKGLHGPWPAGSEAFSTATGQRRVVTLPDGSRVDLDTATSMKVDFNGGLRRVGLTRGRLLITTAHASPGRPTHDMGPFVVDTADGRMRALGTRFAVEHEGSGTQLTVFEGAVEILPALAAEASRVIVAGQQARFTQRSVVSLPTADSSDDAWVRGMLVARDMPLSSFIGELSRYRRGLLRCDPAIGSLKVSGVYPLDDTDRVIDMIQRALPIQAIWRTRYWVTLQPIAG